MQKDKSKQFRKKFKKHLWGLIMKKKRQEKVKYVCLE